MTVSNPLAAANSAQSSPPNTKTSSSSDSSTTGQSAVQNQYLEFIKLLTTEMQNQDPTNPTPESTIMNQTATLAQLSQNNTMVNTLNSLAGAFSASLNNYVDYIGKSVVASGNTTVLASGQAEITYTLPKAAASVNVSIMDSNGNVVSSGPGNKAAGQNVVYWNGQNESGTALADGAYTVKITAKDDNGNTIAPTSETSGVVTSVVMQDGSPVLMMGNTAVPLTDVISVGKNPFTAATT